MKKRLVVIPSDPISAYERAGYSSWLEDYYNPERYFDEVFAISPNESGENHAYGMTIIGTQEAQFRNVIRSINPYAVRAYGGHWPSDIACRNRVAGIPVVVSLHDTSSNFIHRSVRTADIVICMSQAVAKAAVDVGAEQHRIRILPNRIDSSIFHPIDDQAALNSLSTKFPPGRHILHVGRKSEQKNIDSVIKALTYLPQDYHAIFVGRGDAAPFMQLAQEKNVDHRCFWLDAIKNHELPTWYSWCDCTCIPSRWEGFGIVFIEAAACGSAIVTSDIAPMNEYLKNDVSACLIKQYEQPQMIAEGILKVCEDDSYRSAIQSGALTAVSQFEKRVVDHLETGIYDELCHLTPRVLTLRERMDCYPHGIKSLARSLLQMVATPIRLLWGKDAQ